MFSLLAVHLPSPSSSQATCAFIRAELPEISSSDLPIEPRHQHEDGALSHCRPSGPNCCTTNIEKEFLRISQSQLEERVKSQIGLLRANFNQTAHKFRVHFKSALNATSNLLRRLFRRTYGRFFLQNQMIFDEFFLEMADGLSGNANFSGTLQKFFERIYIAEFSLLNPLHPISFEAEACMLEFFPTFKPFGEIPRVISSLMGRTFGLWTSLLCALENAHRQLESLEKMFSLPHGCPSALVRMRYCHLCSPESLMQRPCPQFCQNVLKGCLVELAELDGQWSRLVEIMLHLIPLLNSVHNPHLALHPLPVQISDAIMHFQEKGQLFSSRILFRCFREDFQKLISARRRRDIEEMANSTHSEYEEEDTLLYDDALGDFQFQLFDVNAIQSVKNTVDQFKDELLRITGFWRSLPRMLCQEGGIQSRSGEFCWNGTTTIAGRYRGIATNKHTNLEYNEHIRLGDKYATLRRSFDEIAERLATQNGLIYEQKMKNRTESSPLEEEGIPPDDEDSVEGSGNLEEEDDDDEEEGERRQDNFGIWQRRRIGAGSRQEEDDTNSPGNWAPNVRQHTRAIGLFGIGSIFIQIFYIFIFRIY